MRGRRCEGRMRSAGRKTKQEAGLQNRRRDESSPIGCLLKGQRTLHAIKSELAVALDSVNITPWCFNKEWEQRPV